MSGCQLQRELRNAAAARDVHKEALDLAQQGLTQLEDALAKEQAIHQEAGCTSFCADATSFGIAPFVSSLKGNCYWGLVGVDWCPPMKGVDVRCLDANSGGPAGGRCGGCCQAQGSC